MIAGWELLTAREREAVLLHLSGYGVQQIADALVISFHTAKMHLRNSREKLAISGAGEAAWLPVAIEYGRQMEREAVKP